jgi:parvulin-like peptidyl-prolyl isomerase
MWTLTKLFIAGTVALFCFQSSSPNSGSVPGGTSLTSGSVVPADKTTTAAPTQPVITVHNICAETKDATASQPGPCATVISREEFGNLVKALNPGDRPVPANGRKNLAKSYADYLAIEAAARKSGMEDTPEFRELMNWTRLKAIAELYRGSLQRKYENPSQEEIDSYYKQHAEDFERVNLARILIPRESASAPDKDDFARKAHEVAVNARASLIAGSDPLQVQTDAYSALGLSAPPHPDLGERRRADLLPEEVKEVFSLQPGDVTEIQTEPKNFVVYKVLAKNMVSEDAAKRDISREVYEQNFKKAIKTILDAAPADYDEQYLQPSPSPAPGKLPLDVPPTKN